MEHTDHVDLLRDGVRGGGGQWADLGSGRGAFTLALADLLGSGGEIWSLDRDASALADQRRVMTGRFPALRVHYRVHDFALPLDLPALDGVVMANSLHFVAAKGPVLQRVRGCLRPGGRLILVEYDTDRGNPWVPHPIAYPTWEALAGRAGFLATRLLTTVPSRFLGRIYAALSLAP
ncbi:MAG: class I SAM-dependent methyltransferase [Candidatus Limnocylindrales bacterium]